MINFCYSLYLFFFFFLMIRRPPRSTPFPTRRSSDLGGLRRPVPRRPLRLTRIGPIGIEPAGIRLAGIHLGAVAHRRFRARRLILGAVALRPLPEKLPERIFGWILGGFFAARPAALAQLLLGGQPAPVRAALPRSVHGNLALRARPCGFLRRLCRPRQPLPVASRTDRRLGRWRRPLLGVGSCSLPGFRLRFCVGS